MYEIRKASVQQMLDSATELFKEHYEEVALNKQVMVLAPFVEKYLALEASGEIFVLALYKDDEVIGYSVNFLYFHLHYASLKMCSNDLLFVKKEHRNGRAGYMLIKETEEFAKELDAQLMFWHAKPNTALETLMPRLGYKYQDIIFSKEI
jgi:GNAT superfamily N-acetyltransferase